jgi:DNA-binding IclR family transcriptional regulator
MNNTLANGLTLLGFLSRTADGFGVSELAVELKLPKSHVHRLLQTLVEMGYVVQDEDRTYRIGLRPLELSSALLHNLPLRAAAMPLLHDLAESTGMDAIISIPHEGTGLIIGAIYSQGRQRDPGAAIGSRLHPERSATGALFAACIPGFAKPTDSRAAAEIRRPVKDPTFATSNGMAAAIRDLDGTVCGALGLAAPADQFQRRFTSASTVLRRAAERLSESLASQPSI